MDIQAKLTSFAMLGPPGDVGSGRALDRRHRHRARSGHLPDSHQRQLPPSQRDVLASCASASRGGARPAGGVQSVEAQVAAAGLADPEDGAASAEERIAGATHMAKIRMERRLAFLGTLGANAPFIGLLGTVIGIIRAFAELNESRGQGHGGPDGEVGEALVATAIGIMVAIPAIAVFNAFQRRSRRASRAPIARPRGDGLPEVRSRARGAHA